MSLEFSAVSPLCCNWSSAQDSTLRSNNTNGQISYFPAMYERILPFRILPPFHVCFMFVFFDKLKTNIFVLRSSSISHYIMIDADITSTHTLRQLLSKASLTGVGFQDLIFAVFIYQSATPPLTKALPKMDDRKCHYRVERAWPVRGKRMYSEWDEVRGQVVLVL